MEKMEKYLEKKKNEKNDTFEQILEKDREAVSKECERDAKKKQNKYNFDELKKIGLDLTPYKENYPEFSKKIIELFIKLKNEEQKNIYSGLKSNFELNQDIILNSSCFSEICVIYINSKEKIWEKYGYYLNVLEANAKLPILSLKRINMKILFKKLEDMNNYKKRLGKEIEEDIESLNNSLTIASDKDFLMLFLLILTFSSEKFGKGDGFRIILMLSTTSCLYKFENKEILGNFHNIYYRYAHSLKVREIICNSLLCLNEKRILMLEQEKYLSFQVEFAQDLKIDTTYIIKNFLGNHKDILQLYIKKLSSESKINFGITDISKFDSLILVNTILAEELYKLIDFTIENIYNSKILKNLSRELLENTKQKLEKFEKIKKSYIENKLKKSKNDNVSKDENYWEKLSLSVAFSILFFNLKSIELENTKSLYNKISENEFELNIDTNKEFILNTETLEKIKYKDIKSNKKQPNDFKERIEIIKKLIRDLNKYDNGVQCPISEKTIIFLYWIIYLTDEYNFNNLKLKSYVNSIDFEKKDEEYFLFISELKNIIIQSFSIIAKDKETMAIIIEIREILIRFLKFILNIPVPQLSNLILKEFLKELNNILE